MIKKSALICVTVIALSSCTKPSPQMYMRNHGSSLYNYKYHPSEKNLARHKTTLQDIIRGSKANSFPVPPGIYAELGQVFLEEGKQVEALQYFNLEKETYPEATIFMNRLISSVEQKSEVAQ